MSINSALVLSFVLLFSLFLFDKERGCGEICNEKEGFGSAFTITICEDGSFHYYVGALSSYIGMGEWTLEGDTFLRTEKE